MKEVNKRGTEAQKIRNIEDKQQSEKCKSSYINNCIKCEKSKCPDRKEEIVRMDQKQNPTICLLQGIHFKFKNRRRLEVKERNDTPHKWQP